MNYRCTPLSRSKIRDFAYQIRQTLHLELKLYFPVEKFLEILHELIGDPNFSFQVIPDSEWDQMPNIHAFYNLEENCIFIRDSVYEGAANGNGRDRMTIVHECAHAILLHCNGISLTRSFSETVPAYCDPEWQAKCLAAELMVPFELTKNMSAHDIAQKCGVSMAAARYQVGKRIA